MAKKTTRRPRALVPEPSPVADMTKFADGKGMVEARIAFDEAGLGYQRAHGIQGESYMDHSTVIIVPTRGMIHHKVISSWQNMIAPMNQKRFFIYAAGHEVGRAYNEMITWIMAHPDLSKWKYVLTLEDDNIQPQDAHIRLLETIEKYKFDAVSGMYWTKGENNQPMAYGDPEEYAQTGVLDFRPRDVRTALSKGQIMEVNGIAMGCSLYRMDLFRQIAAPWFVSFADVTEKGPAAFTQDLWFCQRAKALGKRFAVDFRVPVGHMDINTGVVY